MSTQGFASIGIKVTIDDSELNYVTGLGDFGAEPATLDSTCLKDRMKHSRAGVQDVGNFPIDYLFDNSDTDSDFRVLKAKQDNQDHTIKVEFPDGTEFSSQGTITTWVVGPTVNNLIMAKASMALSQDWVVKNPTT